MLKVLYDFDAEAGTELTVKEGDVLTILSKDAGDGWWNARLVFTFIRVWCPKVWVSMKFQIRFRLLVISYDNLRKS